MNRVVLVTGVAGGIGRATGKAFANAGWHVVGVDRQRLESLPEITHFIHADLSDPDEVERLFGEVAHKEGYINALINNAAIQLAKPLVEVNPDEWDEIMAANVRSIYLAMRYAYPLMRPRGGAVVNVSSVHAIATSKNIATYAASKGAVLALTRAMAIEWAPDRIRVNAVVPGAVDTPMLRAGLNRGHLKSGHPQQQVEELGQRIVIGRVGKPEEIAEAILFLADERRSAFMTGETLVVDGGATVKLSSE